MTLLTFDEQFYLANNPDVNAAVEDSSFETGLQHYERFGDTEGRNPSRVFDTGFYLAANPDVAAAGVNPLQHYETFGQFEGRQAAHSYTFDQSFYLDQNPDVAAAIAEPDALVTSAFQHFALFGADEGRSPSAATPGALAFLAVSDPREADGGPGPADALILSGDPGGSITFDLAAGDQTPLPDVQQGFEALDLSAITGGDGHAILADQGTNTLAGSDGDDRLNGGAGQDTLTGGAGADRFGFDGDPFDGADVSEAGRQIIGNEDFITDFDFGRDAYLLNASDFGLAADVGFTAVDATRDDAVIPAGTNVIVLLNSDNDGDPDTPFGAGTAADQIAALVDEAGAGLFVYADSDLQQNRVVFSTDLSSAEADLKILSRQTDLTGQDAIDALGRFSADTVIFEDSSFTLFVFGDSLSDTGNVFAATMGGAPPSPAFFEGRFSNGPNWVDVLAETLGVTVDLAPMPGKALDGSINFALGGTQSGQANPLPVPGGPTLPGALGQIDQYLTDFDVDSEALHVIWTGANDYILPEIEPFSLGPDSDVFADPDVANTVDTIIDGVGRLIAGGAGTILVPNLPDLGSIPLARILEEALDDPDLPARMSGFTDAHNAALATALGDLQSAHPDVEIVSLDIFEEFETILDTFPVADRGVIEGCLFDPGACEPMGETGDGFVFWDEQHPTTEAHALFAAAAAEALGLTGTAMDGEGSGMASFATLADGDMLIA